MVDLYTEVGADPLHGYACHGRKTRAEAIAEAKAHFEHVLVGVQRNLAAIADHTIKVVVVRGRYRTAVVEVLEPAPKPVTDPCPDCGAQLGNGRGGGVVCLTPGCGYGFCY